MHTLMYELDGGWRLSAKNRPVRMRVHVISKVSSDLIAVVVCAQSTKALTRALAYEAQNSSRDV